MKKSVAVVSIVLLGNTGATTARDVGRRDVDVRSVAHTVPHTALVTCHRAGAPVSTARGTRPEKVRRARHWAALPSRMALDIAQIEAVVMARMPNQDAAFQREVARVIDEEARQAGLDPLLMLALIHVESSFDPGALSDAGAIGLMQLRERTLHREIARAGLAPADPRDPVANVRAGTRYLRRLVTAFGSTDLALMAYNAGPNRILSYYRAGEIPERFHVYPRRIRSERERLRSIVERRHRGTAAAPSVGAAS
jgi:hypothetical protein